MHISWNLTVMLGKFSTFIEDGATGLDDATAFPQHFILHIGYNFLLDNVQWTYFILLSWTLDIIFSWTHIILSSWTSDRMMRKLSHLVDTYKSNFQTPAITTINFCWSWAFSQLLSDQKLFSQSFTWGLSVHLCTKKLGLVFYFLLIVCLFSQQLLLLLPEQWF